MGISFGVCLPNFGLNSNAESIALTARTAEELGFDSIWVTDHILMPKEIAHPYGRIYEPVTTLSYVAALTNRIRLGTSILVIPMRNALIAAKELASLDDLSGGRVIAGVAVGWAEEEFRNLGVIANFRVRGKLLSEAIEVMRKVWSEETPTFEGAFFRFKDAVFQPQPRQKGGPPIWVGGNSRAALRRALRLADGWHFTGIGLEDFHDRIGLVKASRRSDFLISGRFTVDLTGRAPRETRTATGERRVVLSGSAQEIINTLEAYVEAGLSYAVVYMGDKPAAEYAVDLRAFAQKVVPSFS